MLDNQARELEIRSEEVAMREREAERNHSYAMKALDAQVVDRKDDRIFQKGFLGRFFTFSIIVLVIVVFGFSYALYLNKDQVVLEIVKAIVFIVSGGLGGYSLKSIKDKKQEDSDDE